MRGRRKFLAFLMAAVLILGSASIATADRPGSIRVLDANGNEVQGRTFPSIDAVHVEGSSFQPGTNYIRVVIQGGGNDTLASPVIIEVTISSQGTLPRTSLAPLGALPDGNYKVQIAPSIDFAQSDIKDDHFSIRAPAVPKYATVTISKIWQDENGAVITPQDLMPTFTNNYVIGAQQVLADTVVAFTENPIEGYSLAGVTINAVTKAAVDFEVEADAHYEIVFTNRAIPSESPNTDATINITKIWLDAEDQVVTDVNLIPTFTNEYAIGPNTVPAGTVVAFAEAEIEGYELAGITVDGAATNNVSFTALAGTTHNVVFTNRAEAQELPAETGTLIIHKAITGDEGFDPTSTFFVTIVPDEEIAPMSEPERIEIFIGDNTLTRPVGRYIVREVDIPERFERDDGVSHNSVVISGDGTNTVRITNRYTAPDPDPDPDPGPGPNPNPNPNPDPDPDPSPEPEPEPEPQPEPEPGPDATEEEIEDEEVPVGPVVDEETGMDDGEEDEEEIILDEEIPLGPPVLPKTSGASPALFYGLGLSLAALGIGIRKR